MYLENGHRTRMRQKEIAHSHDVDMEMNRSLSVWWAQVVIQNRHSCILPPTLVYISNTWAYKSQRKWEILASSERLGILIENEDETNKQTNKLTVSKSCLGKIYFLFRWEVRNFWLIIQKLKVIELSCLQKSQAWPSGNFKLSVHTFYLLDV